MGTDIHGVFQRRNNVAWEDIPSKYEQQRHYQLFAVLAGVRNGTGFAGCKTGEPVKPISEPRDLPKDFQVNDDDMHPIAALSIMAPRRQKWYEKDEPLEVWMGDHSHSWLTDAEMLAWYEKAPIATKSGIFDRDDYERWDKKSPPDFGYCGGIGGANIVLVNDTDEERNANPGWTHIRCEWKSPLSEELAYFFDEVKRLQDEHGEIRFVFGFDS